MKICYIIGAAKAPELYIKKENSFVIAADGGLLNLEETIPDISVGDFDSLGFVPKNCKTEVLPVEKDVTDTAYAAYFAEEKGFKTIVIYGGMGGRPDHTFANISLLASLSKKGIRAYLIGDGYVTTAITDSNIDFEEAKKGTVSVFSADTVAEGVTEEGLKYPLQNYNLKFSDHIGVSNSFTGAPSSVSVENGTIIVMWQEENIKDFIDKL